MWTSRSDAGGGDSCQSDSLPLLRDSLSDGEGEGGRKIDGSTVPNLSLTTSLQGKHSAQGADALVGGGSSTSNLIEPSRTTSFQG